MSKIVNATQLNYFATGLYAKIKENFDAKGSAATAETNAKAYADGLNTAMDTRMTTAEGDIAVLKGDATTQGSVAYQIAQVVAGADASFDTLKEIADWIINDTVGAAQMANDIQANAQAISDLEALVGTIPSDATATDIVGYIQEYVTKALEDSDLSQYAKAEDLEALKNVVGTASDDTNPATGIIADIEAVEEKAQANEDAIAVLNGSDTEDGSVAKAVKDGVAEANAYADGLNTTMDGRMTTVEGKVSANEGAIAQAQTDIANNTTAIGTNASDIATLQTDLAQAQTDIAANTQAIGQAITDLEAYADQAEADAKAYADELNTAMTEKVNGVEEKVDTNTGAITQLQTDVSTNTTNISTNTTNISDLTTRVEALEEPITNAEIDAIIAGLQ